MGRIGIVVVVLLSTTLAGCELEGKGGKGLGGGALTEEEFSEAFFDVMCEESGSCGDGSMADIWCNPATDPTGTATVECTFDPEMGQQCLDGTYTCNSDLTGFEFVEPPTICIDVFDCGTPTTTVDG